MPARKPTFLIMLLMVLAIAGQAAAAEQRGSISLTFSYQGAVVSGGSVSLYCVTDLATDTSAQSARQLAQQVAGLTGDTKSIEQGRVLFDGLSPGLYLLVQETASPGFLPISPFLIDLPMEQNGSPLYCVNAAPKMAPCGPSPETGQPRWPFILFWVSGTVLVLATIGKKFRLR